MSIFGSTVNHGENVAEERGQSGSIAPLDMDSLGLRFQSTQRFIQYWLRGFSAIGSYSVNRPPGGLVAPAYQVVRFSPVTGLTETYVVKYIDSRKYPINGPMKNYLKYRQWFEPQTLLSFGGDSAAHYFRTVIDCRGYLRSYLIQSSDIVEVPVVDTLLARGRLPILSDKLRALQQFHWKSIHRQYPLIAPFECHKAGGEMIQQEVAEEIRASFRLMGLNIGVFLADLHSPGILKKVKKRKALGYPNSATGTDTYKAILEPLEGILDTFRLGEQVVGGSGELLRRAKADFFVTHVNPVINVGDVWARNFVFSDHGISRKPLDRSTCLCWGRGLAESVNGFGIAPHIFSGYGRGVNGDMPQLLADLHAYYLAAEPESPLQVAVKALIDGITQAYRRRSVQFKCSWVPSSLEVNRVNTQFLLASKIPLEDWTSPPSFKYVDTDKPVDKEKLAALMRSAWLCHGRELVLIGATRRNCCLCCPTGANTECKVRRRIVERGCWYLTMAGEDLEEFRDVHWSRDVWNEEPYIVNALFLGL